MDIALICVCDDNWITDSSNPCDFCRKYVRRNSLLNERCRQEHKEWERLAKKARKPILFECHIGFTNFAVPVIIGEDYYLGCSIGGQVLTKNPNEKHYLKIAKEFNINEKEFISALKEVAVLPEEKIKTAMEILFLVSTSLAATAYANYHLAKFGSEYNIPRNTAMEEWFFSNYGKTKRPISSREYDVLKLLAAGKSNAEIAKELFISVHTAKAHVSSIIEKFEATDRVQVAVKAVREGLI